MRSRYAIDVLLVPPIGKFQFIHLWVSGFPATGHFETSAENDAKTLLEKYEGKGYRHMIFMVPTIAIPPAFCLIRLAIFYFFFGHDVKCHF